MTFAAPANRNDLLFLEPSLRWLFKHLNFSPSLVLADMAYINLAMQTRLREEMQIGVLTKLPPNYDLPKSVEPALLLRCRQGQKLRWLGLHEKEKLHWFGVAEEEPTLCPFCWERSSCPREFSFAPTEHEIALGSIPVNTPAAQRLLKETRCWIEAAQSYEKNQLGLNSLFLNSLRFTSIMCLLADMVGLLRAHAFLSSPPSDQPLKNLFQTQLSFGLD